MEKQLPKQNDRSAEIREKQYQRFVTFTRELVDVEKRTATLAFASETPVNRFYGREILDCSGKCVDMSRMQSGAALLLEHDRGQQIGVVESATCDPDKVCRAVVRFGKGKLADEIMQDVADGIRRNVSVGYAVNDVELTESDEDDGDTYRITNWTPLEVSIVSVPADPKVGINRTAEPTITEPPKQAEQTQKQETRTMAENTETKPALPQVVDHSETLKVERARVTEIRAIGAQFDVAKDADAAIDSGMALEDFRKMTMAKIAERQSKAAPMGMSQKETRAFSLCKAIEAQVSGDWRQAGLEQEAIRAYEKHSGRVAKGILVPEDVLRDWNMGRVYTRTAQNVTTDSQGGYLVATQQLAGSFIEALLANTTFLQTGVTMLTGLRDSITIPSQLTATSGYWVGEQTDLTESNMTFGQVALAPKTVGATARTTRKLMQQSNPTIEMLLRNDLTKTVARKIDIAGFEGTGTTQFTGITNLGGNVNTVAFNAAPTWAKIVDMRTAVGADKVPFDGSAAYVGSPEFVGKCQQTQKYSSTNGVSIMEDVTRLNGYRFLESTNITNTNLFFGVWSNVIVGMWGGLDILVDPTTYVLQGGLRLVAFQDVDMGVRHDEAFCYSTGMTVS